MTMSEEQPTDSCPPGIIINEVQLILAEKRTSLASLRVGIAVFAIPLSIMGVLVATSRYYEILDVLHLFVAVMVMNALLLIAGFLPGHTRRRQAASRGPHDQRDQAQAQRHRRVYRLSVE